MRGISACLAIGASLAGACSAGGTLPAENFAAVELQLPEGENALHIADFTGDGIGDLISASEVAGQLAIRAGNRSGQLSAPISIAAGDLPTWIDSADVDGDGSLDLVVANHEQSYLTIINGNGSGEAKAVRRVPLPAELSPHVHMVRAADLNGDGAVDLIIDSRDFAGAFVLLQDADKGLDFAPMAVDAQGSPYLGFAIGDVNADGAPDMATPNAGDVSVLLNSGSDELAFELSQQISSAAPFAAALGDMDCDGIPDLIIASEEAGAGLTVPFGDGGGAFAQGASFRASMRDGAKQVAMGDVNGDGCIDAVVTAWSGEASLFKGAAALGSISKQRLSSSDNPWSVAMGDLDDDGKADIIIADGQSGAARVLRWREVD